MSDALYSPCIHGVVSAVDCEKCLAEMNEPVVAYVWINGNFGLTKTDLWPNDDAPENPTFQEIMEALRGASPDDMGIFPKIEVAEPGGRNVEEWPWT